MPPSFQKTRPAPPRVTDSVQVAALRQAQIPSPPISAGVALLVVFMIYSRSLELFVVATGVRLPYLLSGLLILVFLAGIPSGRLLKCIGANRSLRYFLLFTVWMGFCSPFSYWRGGTASLLVFNWLPLIIGLIGIGAAIYLPRSMQRLAGVMALSAMAISFSSLVFGRFDTDDRLRVVGGTLGNSNDLALLILAGVPFLFLLLFDKAWGVVSKVAALITIPVAILAVLRTGSRAALMALLATFFLLLVLSYGATRLKLLMTGTVLAVVMASVLSERLTSRLGTLFKDDETIVEASESRKQRTEKLLESIEMTFQHPLFGVGPGVHDSAQADLDRQAGQRPDWQVSHNTFTQVSSETGIPGFLLYMAAVLGPLWRLWRARAALFQVESLTPYRNLLSAFLASGLSLVVTNIFGSNAYLFYMPLMLVLIDNAAMMSRQLVAESQVSVAPGRPLPAMPGIPSKPPGARVQSPWPSAARFTG